MCLPQPLPYRLIELVARRFRALGEPMRIKLLDSLRQREASVRELCEATGMSQQNVSKHLGVLLEVGIVGRRKAGNQVFYSIADEGIFRLCEEACGGLQRQVAELSLGAGR